MEWETIALAIIVAVSGMVLGYVAAIVRRPDKVKVWQIKGSVVKTDIPIGIEIELIDFETGFVRRYCTWGWLPELKGKE